MTLSITILGCASSGGVPRVGAGWGACDPGNPKNRRRRCSILLRQQGEEGVTTVLVDTTPDVREQLLDNNISSLDGILFTHDHADHTHGIDDLRPLVIHSRRRLDAWIDEETSSILRPRFGYVFETPPGSDYPPILIEHRAIPGETIEISGPGGSLKALPFALTHGSITALGYRFGNVAYTPDVSDIPPESLHFLEDLDVWIIDALRYKPHPTHFSLSEALDWIARMKPKRSILTNLHNDLDYETLRAELPPHIEPAFDGMVI